MHRKRPSILPMRRDQVIPEGMVDALALDMAGPPEWRHIKSGGYYEEVGRGKFAYGDGAFLDVMIYRSMQDGVIWVRDLGEFLDGRFEQTWPGGWPPRVTTVLEGMLESDQSPVVIVPSGETTAMVFRKGTFDVG